MITPKVKEPDTSSPARMVPVVTKVWLSEILKVSSARGADAVRHQYVGFRKAAFTCAAKLLPFCPKGLSPEASYNVNHSQSQLDE
jgi:hypothetical protein